jgi:hypothetical protein
MEKFGTGDINLATSLMSIGIPNAQDVPCKIISHENGSVYSRYYFEPHSLDGKHDSISMSRAWSRMETLPAHHPLHHLSAFVKTSQKGFTPNDWLAHAIESYDLKHVATFEDASRHIAKFSNNAESYCLAFAINRKELLHLHRIAVQSIYMTNGKASAMIDAKLPQNQKRELASRLNG